MSEDIGRKIAEKFGEKIAKGGTDSNANQERANLNARIMETVRRQIYAAVNGFNNNAPAGVQLVLIDGDKSLIFNLQEQLTLTLRFRDQLIELLPGRRNTTDLAPSKLQVWQAESDFNYRFVNENPTVNPPVLSSSRFIEGVINVACGQPF
ncbi:MAG: hypothetical protein ABI197_13855 [Granulicella sp.]